MTASLFPILLSMDVRISIEARISQLSRCQCGRSADTSRLEIHPTLLIPSSIACDFTFLFSIGNDMWISGKWLSTPRPWPPSGL